MIDIVRKSRELMKEQTKRNNAPAWPLTEMAIEKGRELSKKYNVNEKLVLTSLYLAHVVFNPVWKGSIQKHHPKLSAGSIKKYLDEWKVPVGEQKIILNSIEARHERGAL